MDLTQILKLAETDKISAYNAFSNSRYGNIKIKYHEKEVLEKGYGIAYYKGHRKYLHIANFELWKLFLQVFGHLLKDITVVVFDEEEGSHSFNEILDPITLYSTSIQKLSLKHLLTEAVCCLPNTERVYESSKNPVRITRACPSLQSLNAEYIHFEEPMKMAELFPNLSWVHLEYVSSPNPPFIETNLPRLEHFSCQTPSPEDDEVNWALRYLSYDNVKAALEWNPQLKSIHIEMAGDAASVEFINEVLPNLEKLHISFDFDIKSSDNNNDIVFKKVTEAELDNQLVEKIPMAFERLNILHFHDFDRYAIGIDFIKEQVQLTELTIRYCDYTAEQAIDIVTALSELKELHLSAQFGNKAKWSARALVRLLVMCERLQKMSLAFYMDSKEPQHWRSYVSDIYEIEKSEKLEMWDPKNSTKYTITKG